MTLVSSPSAKHIAADQTRNTNDSLSSYAKKGFKIIISDEHTDPNPMLADLKREVQEEAPSMMELFEEVLKAKGEYDSESFVKRDDNTVEVKYVSSIALHSFALKAAEYGKDITYKKETSIIISE